MFAIIAEIKQKKTYRLRIPTSNETVNSFVVFRSTVSTHDTVNNVQCTLLFYPMILFVGYLGCPFFAGFSLLCSIFFTIDCVDDSDLCILDYGLVGIK